MKKVLYIFSIIALAGISCTDLTEDLYDKIPAEKYPENDLQIATMTVDAYAKLRPLADDEGWWYLAQEMTSDELCGPTRDADWDDGGKWRVMHQHNWTNDVEGVNNMWGRIYEAVTTTNQISDRLAALTQTDEIKVKIAEVETMRAFYY